MFAKFLPALLISASLVVSGVASFAGSDTEKSGTQATAPDYSIELFVNEPWLSAIRDGTKKVEGRAGRLDEFSGWIGKRARFHSSEQEVIVTVSDVHHYNTLQDFLRVEGWKNAAPHLKSEAETAEAYLNFYPGDHIAKAGGMNGIMISVVRVRPISGR
jgi:ASC-1-like (ASCH) protein